MVAQRTSASQGRPIMSDAKIAVKKKKINLAMSQAVPIDPVHCESPLGLYRVK